MDTFKKNKTRFLEKTLRKIIFKIIPELYIIQKDIDWDYYANREEKNKIRKNVCIYSPKHIDTSEILDYTYISYNSWISNTKIGKYCSVGPNLVCGWGIHPTNGLSTSPSFYSTKAPNNVSFTKEDKILERKPITIGNDVFIGANVTILDGVTIGDGAIIGAGAVVSKDIPPYAIAIGCPIEIKRFRFNEEQIDALKRIEWWNFEKEKMKDVESYFFDVDAFLKKYSKNNKLQKINDKENII